VGDNKPARILVIGGGAIGGVMAARLTRTGHDVTVLDAYPAHVDLMRDPGLEVDLVGEKDVVPLNAVSEVSRLSGTFDFGLVTLKAPHIRAALEPLVEMGCVDTFVVLGNGLVQDSIQEVVGPEKLLVGTVSWGATNLAPGRVAQTTFAPIAIGELDGKISARLESLGAVLSNVAEVHFTDNIQGQVWSKLLLNSSFSGLGVVTGLVYGDVVALPRGADVARALWSEGYQVAMAMNMDLDVVAGIEPRDIAVLEPMDLARSNESIDLLMSSLGATKASMLQDIEKGAVTEVDVINGGVSAAGRKVGIPTPLNDAVVAIVHDYENNDGSPAPDQLSSLILIAEAQSPI
jgi:2-dehydropantoate 2-reductase